MQTGQVVLFIMTVYASLASGGPGAERGGSSQGYKQADERADPRQASGAAA